MSPASLTQAGLTTPQQIIEGFRAMDNEKGNTKPPWQLKRITMTFATAPYQRQRGIAGNLSEDVFEPPPG